MFSGYFTAFTGTWMFVPVENKTIQTDVETDLENHALDAINSNTSLIWLYWPYSDSSQADDIENVLRDVEKRLTRHPRLKRFARYYISVKTYLMSNKKAQAAILCIKVND